MDLHQGIEKLRAIQLPTIPTINLSNIFSYSAGGIPIMTYGMIGITTVVLAAVTIFDDQSEKETEAKIPDLGLEPAKEVFESEEQESEESEEEPEQANESKIDENEEGFMSKEEENSEKPSLLPDLESFGKSSLPVFGLPKEEEKPKTSSLLEEDESRGGKRSKSKKQRKTKSKKQRKTKSKKLNTKK